VAPEEPARLSVQETLYPELTCFGCGPANPDGLHLRSFRTGELTVATFVPRAEHDNGFGFLNGGIISTVLDCHSAAVVMFEAAQRGYVADEGIPIPFVTAGLDVRFTRPTPLGPPLDLRAVPVEVSESAVIVTAELSFEGKIRASSTSRWLRFRSR
jgi:acyl-coenzyme A thioesterase PaaI-like protein